jgi:hypothetical protein
MTTLVAQIAPQRSTQYADLAHILAPHELRLSPLGPHLAPGEDAIRFVQLGGQEYLRIKLTAPPDEALLREMGMLAMTSAFFDFFEQIATQPGPFLRPIEARFTPALPPDLVMTRRYRGKTNELFTHFLCNVARHSSAFADQPWSALRLFDPLAGGGTTLFTALVLGADAAGVEKDAQDVESTATFVQQYAREEGIACTVKEERLKKVGRRWWFTLGKERPQRLILASGDTARSDELMANVKKPHLIVADLPYGIQHHGELTGLLSEALPVWSQLLLPGGAMALAWESTRFPREEMVALVESVGALSVLNDPPYTLLAHRVDRVIKNRDVLIVRKTAENENIP